MKFDILNGEYPFDVHLGTVEADTAEDALATAVAIHAKDDHQHVVVQPSAQFSPNYPQSTNGHITH